MSKKNTSWVWKREDLLIAAHCSRNLTVWPLSRIDAGFDLREGTDKSSALSLVSAAYLR